MARVAADRRRAEPPRETMMVENRFLRVRNWETRHENNRSRELKRTDWFPFSNELSADSYVELVTHDDGASHLGVWAAILMVASKANPRGVLVRDDGRPHNAASLARVTRLAEQIITTAIDRLLVIGLLEMVDDESHPVASTSHPGARKPAGRCEKIARECRRREGNRTSSSRREWNRKEKKRKRTEPQGRERARDERTTGRSGAPPAAADSSQKGDDAAENPGVAYASPEDELKAIYQAKTREPITTELLRAIRVNLELSGVSVGDFVVQVRKHTQNKWRNPAGFLRDLSKRFRAKTRAAAGPVTLAEAEAKDYRCPICGSTVRGEGGVPDGNGAFVPCACASPDWIAQQRARGIFAPEEPPR